MRVRAEPRIGHFPLGVALVERVLSLQGDGEEEIALEVEDCEGIGRCGGCGV